MDDALPEGQQDVSGVPGAVLGPLEALSHQTGGRAHPHPQRVVVLLGPAELRHGPPEATIELLLHRPGFAPEPIIGLLQSYYFSTDQPIIQYLPECARYDPQLTYTLKPGHCRFQGRYFDTWVEVNRLGTRDDDSSLIGPELIVIGDSESMGWGVKQQELYSEIIKGKQGHKVLNLAVSSYGTVRELQMLARADTSRLQILIVQYSNNDLWENIAYFESGNHLPISTQAEYEERCRSHLANLAYYPGKHLNWLLHETWHRLWTGRTSSPMRGWVAAGVVVPDALLAAPHGHYFWHALRHAETSLDGVILVVLAEDHDVLEQLRSLEEKIAPTRLFVVAMPTGRGMRYPLDGHLTAEGHRQLATEILHILASL